MLQNRPNQTDFEKAQVLGILGHPGDLPGSQREDWEVRLGNHICSFGGQFKYPVGVVLCISGGGVIM